MKILPRYDDRSAVMKTAIMTSRLVRRLVVRRNGAVWRPAKKSPSSTTIYWPVWNAQRFVLCDVLAIRSVFHVITNYSLILSVSLIKTSSLRYCACSTEARKCSVNLCLLRGHTRYETIHFSAIVGLTRRLFCMSNVSQAPIPTYYDVSNTTLPYARQLAVYISQVNQVAWQTTTEDMSSHQHFTCDTLHRLYAGKNPVNCRGIL